MNQVIKEILAKRGIRAVLRKKESFGTVNILLLDFLGKDDNYYSFMAAYNDIQIFSRAGHNLLVKDNTSLETLVLNNLLQFETKEEYLEGRWKDVNTRILTEFIEKQLMNSMAPYTGKTEGDIELIKINPIMQPFCGYIVYYRYKAEVQLPALCVFGQGLVSNNVGYSDAFTALQKVLLDYNLIEREL